MNYISAAYQFDKELVTKLLEEQQANIKKDMTTFAEHLKSHHVSGYF